MENILNAEGITVSFGQREILHHCSFTAGTGEFIGIIGPNGSGKSTLLKALRHLIPYGGKVEIEGMDETRMKEKERARRIAYMQQNFHSPFAYTCREIVMSARYAYLSWWEREGRRDDTIVTKAMEYTGTLKLADASIEEISGGEKQRVLLARVLAQETPLIFLDEPTAALDLLYQEEIFHLCKRLAGQGKTILMICHDITMAARWCSRLIVLHDGTIARDGRPEEVITEETMKDVFRLPSIVYKNPVSGHLDLYIGSHERKENMPELLILGEGEKSLALCRKLLRQGIPMSFGFLHEKSLARTVAKALHIPCVSTEKEETALLKNHERIAAYDADERTIALLNGLSGKTIYSDRPGKGWTVTDIRDLPEKLKKSNQ